METTTLQPATIAEVRDIVREQPQLLPRGGGSKSALSHPRSDARGLDLARLSGILEYDPGEYTFTALAGTRLIDIQSALAEHNQYLPFDPPFGERGATLGGNLAAGMSGSGRYRYGGVRDFVLGVKLVDGNGQLIRGGGKVVKNAAGFDIPKLMVGSLGMFGVLVELTFKVFPASTTFGLVTQVFQALEPALEAVRRLYLARMDIDALDFETTAPAGIKVTVRLGGLPGALPDRCRLVQALLGGGMVEADFSTQPEIWSNDFNAWESATFVKVPLTLNRVAEIESVFAARPASQRHYSAGGNVLWLKTEEPVVAIDNQLTALNLSGLVIVGDSPSPRIGKRSGAIFEQRIKQVFDPHGRFPTY